MLTPAEKSDLLRKARQGVLTKGEARVALLKLEGKFAPAMPAHGQPETQDARDERLLLHPEQFYPDKGEVLQNLGRDAAGVTGLIHSALKRFAPGLGAPSAQDDFFARQEAVRQERLRPRGGQFGGLSARPEGGGLSSLGAGQPPVSEATARGLPDNTGSIEATESKDTFKELILGSAPVAVGKAVLSTPGGVLSNPGLALQRARGTLAKSLQESPLQTVVEMASLGILSGEAARGLIGLTKLSGSAAKGIFESAGRSMGDDFAKAQAKVSELEALGKSVPVPKNEIPQGGWTSADLRKLATQAETEAQSRAMFPYAALPAEKPQTVRGLFSTVPERVFTGAGEKKAVTSVAVENLATGTDVAAGLTTKIVVPETGPAVFKSGVVSKWFSRVKSKATSSPSKVLVGAMDNVFTEHHLTAGRWMEGLRDVGLHKFAPQTRENILLELGGKPSGDALAKGASVQIRKTLDEAADVIEKLGIMVEDGDGNMRAWTRRRDYAPLMVKPDALDAIYGDVEKAMRKVRKQVGDGVPDDAIHSTLTSLHEAGKLKLSDQTRRAIDHVIATNRAKNAGEALGYLGRRSFRDKYRFFGNIDAGRTAHLPLDMYERDAAKVLPEYLYGAARRIAEAKHLGPRGEKMELYLKQIAKSNVKESEYFTEVADVFLGHRDKAFMQANPGLKQLYDYYTNYAVATKIGLGTATIPNITQFAISTLPVFGVQRTAKAALKVAFDPAYRSQLRERGIILSEAMRKIMQQEFGGTAGEFTQKLLVPFETVNKAQKYIAAAAIDDAYDDLARAALNVTDTNHEKALRVFTRLGVTPEQLNTKAGRDKAIFKFAADSQLQKNILNEPLILNNPSMQPFVLFKRFGWGQAHFINDWVVKEVGKGNVMPTLRLLAAGYAGGEFVVGAKERLRAALSGQRQWNPETAWWKKALRAYSEVGSIGVFADLWRIKGEMPEDIWTDIVDNVVFAVSPPPLSDAARAVKIGKDVGSAALERGVAPALRRSAGTVGSALGGPLFGSVAERFKTAAHIEDIIMSRRKNALDNIKSLMVTGRAKRGMDLMGQWNKTYPEYYIEPPTPDELWGTYINRTAKQTEIPVELLK